MSLSHQQQQLLLERLTKELVRQHGHVLSYGHSVSSEMLRGMIVALSFIFDEEANHILALGEYSESLPISFRGPIFKATRPDKASATATEAQETSIAPVAPVQDKPKSARPVSSEPDDAPKKVGRPKKQPEVETPTKKPAPPALPPADEEEEETAAPTPPQKKAAAPIVRPVDEDEEEDETPPPKKPVAPTKPKAAPVDDDEDEEEDETPPPKKPVAPTKPKAAPVDDDEDDDMPPVRKPAAPPGKAKAPTAPEPDDDDDDDWDDED